jgi:Tol biopolymer transport system component
MAGAFSVSDNGTLAYQTGATPSSQLTWLDRDGKRLGVVGEPGFYGDVALSPDGSRVAVTTGLNNSSSRATDTDVWVYDVARGARTRVTFDPTVERFPVWSPDGEQIAFSSNRKDASAVYVKRSSGEGSEEMLFSGNQGEVPFPASWSRDNRSLALVSTGGQSPMLGPAGGDISVLTLIGDRTVTPFLRTPFVENEPRFSPDGRWMAYVSNQSGRGEVYVAPFPGPGASRQISTAGGTQPQWRRDGTEIFYVSGGRLMVSGIKAQGIKLEVGSSRQLFAVAVPVGYGNAYDVTADGQRFLVNSLIDEALTTPVTLVVNWPAMLKK